MDTGTAKTRFLILGAGSFYGRNFAECVERHGDVALRVDRTVFDIDEDRLFSVANGCDVVVNFISRSLVAESWDNPAAWMKTNAERTALLIDDLRLEGVKRFVHVSTPEVYGSTRAWASERHNFNPAIITRTANIYGPGQQPYRIIPHAIDCFRAGRKLQLHGGGRSIRSFIHISDACEATYLAAKEGKLGETYHISGRHSISIHGLIQMICELMGVKMSECVEEVPDRLGKDYSYLLDSSKIRALGWRDRIRLVDGLRALVKENKDGTGN